MLSLIKNISDEHLSVMTTDDYILLSNVFQGKGIGQTDLERYRHLAELGIVKYTENGIELANGIRVDAQSIIPIDSQSIEAIDRKRLIIDCIAENGKATTSQISQYTGLSTTRVRQILQRLVADGSVVKGGNYRYTTYRLSDLE
jgi:predicted transcriptional regulator